MIKKILVAFCFCFMCYAADAQIDHDKAHRRYWYYRTRLINDFMKIGKNQGDCIVIAERNEGKSTLSDSSSIVSQVGPDQIDLINQYIVTLALEYKMLTRANQDASETVNELYHLLYMINRLDMEADQFWKSNPPTGPNITPNDYPNGFMIREDMPPDYLKDNRYHFNYTMQLSGNTSIASTGQPLPYRGFCGSGYMDELVGTKFQSYVNTPNSGEKDEMGMPHDKFHSMLTALMFVIKYLPASVTNGSETFQDGASSLKQEAKNIAARIYQYLKGPGFSWMLVYPDFSGSNLHYLNVGANAGFYSWPLSRMACYLAADFPWSSVEPCVSYDDPTAFNFGKTYYQTTSMSVQPKIDMAVFNAWDQVGSNRHALASIGYSPGIPPIPAYVAMMPNSGGWGLEWSQLARKVLHQNGTLMTQLSVYDNILAAAPCNGPFNYGSGIYGAWEWSAQDRTEHPNSKGSLHPFAADYPGVDYMMLHNLYYEYNNQLMEDFNGNVANWGNLGAIGAAITTFIYNAVNTAVNAITTGACNVANTVAGWFGGSVSCPTSTSGSGGPGSTVAVTPYLPYNLMDNHDAGVWPRTLHVGSSSTVTQGVTTFPGRVAVFQNLSSDAHIFSTNSIAAPSNTIPSKVEYRAGKEITLSPGFTVDAGSDFHAYVQRYLCNGSGDPLNLRKRYDSTAVADSLTYDNDVMNLVPVHYVTAPMSDSDNNPVNRDSTDSQSLLDVDQTQSGGRMAGRASSDNNSPGAANSNRFLIMPNPSNGAFQVQTQKVSPTEIISIRIVDSKGVEMVKADNVESLLDVHMENAGKGIYIVHLVSSEGYNEVKRISID